MAFSPTIAVIGLGYVGLPLAVGLAKSFPVIGFDINAKRVAELKAGHDRTQEISGDRLKASSLVVTADVAAIQAKDIYIVTVPTPVGPDNLPDLGAVRAASRTVAKAMRQGAIVVYESTVYPGVTEDICGPILEAESGLKRGVDFFLGYSPERINPGDTVHTVDKITKVVSAENAEVGDKLLTIYGAVNGGNVFLARDIRTAEAAKVIENAQRDINIAFMNEIAAIFGKMGLSVYDVLDAAGTKWNFLPFTPGFVGGHCIGVDPYYLAHAAQAIGVEPHVILAGRRINDAMAPETADRIADLLAGPSRVLVLGVTFKENVPDIRNSKVFDLIGQLRSRGHEVAAFDPAADPEETAHEYGETLLAEPGTGWDAVVLAVPHADFAALELSGLLKQGGLVADVKGLLRKAERPSGLRYWTL